MASTHVARDVDTNNGQHNTTVMSDKWKKAGRVERVISAVSGGALVAYGIARLDWAGAGIAALGGGLIYRGVSNQETIYERMKKAENEPQQIANNITTIPGNKGIRVKRSITVNATPEALYKLWMDVEKAPLYAPFVESVQKTGERTSHWVGVDPKGRTVEWNFELLKEDPPHMIAWHVHGKPITANAGKVMFSPATGERGTVVTFELDYYQFRGPIGVSAGKLTGFIPEQMTLEALRRFKEFVEAGEVPTTEGQPTGNGRK